MVYVDASGYTNSHGKAPRGFGSWAFGFDRRDALCWVHQATYGQALKVAKRQAGQAGARTIYVQP